MTFEQRRRVFWREHGVGRFRELNPAEVPDQAPRFGHCSCLSFSHAEQFEIAPERGAEKADLSDDDLAAVEHTNVRSGAQPLEFGRCTVDAAAIELVIPENVEHRFL